MIWDVPKTAKEEIDSFAARFGCDPLAAEVFIRRGITQPEKVRFFLDDDLKTVHNPFLFLEMEDTVDRILQAKAEGEKVLVFGDRDVDGITATTLMVSRLREMGIDASWQIPMGDEHYGITEDSVRRFAETDGTLIITVDCGITAVREIDLANSLGIDTIVIDHHNPQDSVPDAVSIINPKLEDSGYPFTGLCGAALAAKVLWALRFAQTELYKERFTLLNVRPGNESVIFEAVKIENLVETDRLIETIVPGVIRPEESRLVDFFAGEALFVYDEKPQLRLMRQVFGPNADIGLTDLAPEIARVFPSLTGVSLLRMLQGSKLVKYSSCPPLEIEAFKQLVVSFLWQKHPELSAAFTEDLDLAALGIVADMMPMLDENRVLVRHGLRTLEKTKKQGVRELLAANKLIGKPVTSQDIGWKIGPIINSTGRMGKPDRAVELLLADGSPSSDISAVVSEVLSMNETRKSLGNQAWTKVLPLARTSRDEFGGRFAIVRDDTVHRGITGILAGKLCRELNAPAAVVAMLEDRAVGSIRSVRGFSVTGFLAHFEDIFENWGGHDAAGGFSLPVARFDEFVARIPAVLDAHPLEADGDERVTVDVVVPPERMDKTIEDIENLFQPVGQEFPRVVFMTKVFIDDVQFLGKTEEHVKMTVSAGNAKWPALMWNASARVGTDIVKHAHARIVYHVERNFWGSNQTLQLHVLDIKRGDPDS